jgi:hypothetical protein
MGGAELGKQDGFERGLGRGLRESERRKKEDEKDSFEGHGRLLLQTGNTFCGAAQEYQDRVGCGRPSAAERVKLLLALQMQ